MTAEATSILRGGSRLRMRKTKVVIGQGATMIVKVVFHRPTDLEDIDAEKDSSSSEGFPYSDEVSGSEIYPCTRSALHVVFQ
jgi:hypothetical protein